MSQKQELITDEGLIVRHSGEIPEIAYYNSRYYLSADPDGPGLELDAANHAFLQEQVIARYREIILRDLNPENRDRSIYRGVRRVMWNWRRLEKFWQRHDLPPRPELKQEVTAALSAFLDNEWREVRAGIRSSCLNCTVEQLAGFLRRMSLDRAPACRCWLELCEGD